MPAWVKATIGLAFAAILLVLAYRFLDPTQGGGVELPGGGGVTVAPQHSPRSEGTDGAGEQPVEGSRATQPSFALKLRRVELFPHSDAAEVQVTAVVNGTEFLYPSLAGVEWLEVAPTMAGQTFKLPSAEEYEIRFEMRKREGAAGKIALLKSVKTITLREATDNGIYQLHGFDPASRTRSGKVSAEVSFALEVAP